MLLEGMNSLKYATKPLSQNTCSFFDLLQRSSLSGKDWLILFIVLSFLDTQKVPRRKYCPKLRHLRLAGVAMREEPSDPPPSGTVFISSPLIHNWPWSLPSILTLPIPLYCLQILWVSLAAPLSTGAVTEQKMTIPRRNPILTGFMAEQAAGRSCWMLLYFSFGLVGGILNWALWCVELNAECLSTQPWS